jgi:hypothetical protein
MKGGQSQARSNYIAKIPHMTYFYRMSLTILLIVLTWETHAQIRPLYAYQDLSHIFYAKQKDSLKKAWVCPSVYKTKETQKQYREIWDQRTDFITQAITDDAYVKDQDVYPYIDGIITQIVQANQQLFPTKPFLLLDRSPSVNAYAIGGNVIAVNLGLVNFSQSREELALAIAHELSHNILEHTETAIKQRAELLTSDEYKKSLNAVLDSKYQRLTRLQKVLESYSFNRSRHQRYHESDADSLAIILLKKSNIAFKADFFLRLDSADILYRQPLKRQVKDYFVSYQLPFQDSWTQKRSRGLSTHNYNFRDTSSIDDSLKTHPDCEERYNRTRKFTVAGAGLTPLPAVIKDKTTKMMLWTMYQNQTLTPCLYRVLMEKDKGTTDEWYDFMLSNIFSGLFYADKELHRFNAIGLTQKEYISKNYYDLQNMLEQMPRESLEVYCKTLQNGSFWKDMSPAERALKNLFYVLTLDPDNSDKNKAKAAKDFTANNSASMYCEFAGNFFQKK